MMPDVPSNKSRPAKFTRYYGPKDIRGPETPVKMTTIKHISPSTDVLVLGVDWLGVDKETTVVTTYRWNFSGYQLPKNRIW
jgi:hypothetical protein